MKYVAFLRAVNVSGSNRISMEELQKVFLETGFANIKTYLQSGNVVFETQESSITVLQDTLETAISQKLGLEVKVLVFSKDEFEKIIQGNEFLSRGLSPDFLHVTLLKEPHGPGLSIKAQDRKSPTEQILLAGRFLYLHCPEGYGKTKLSNTSLEKWAGSVGTTRNWKTIMAVNQLLQE